MALILLWNLHFEHTPLLQCYALHLSFWLRTFKLDRSIWRLDQLFQTTWQLLWQLESLLLTFDLGISESEQKPFVVAKQDWALPNAQKQRNQLNSFENKDVGLLT